MTRAEHLEWTKQRALEYVNAGDLQMAFASLSSDLRKHPDLASAEKTNAEMGMALLINGHLNTADKMRDWIKGFN